MENDRARRDERQTREQTKRKQEYIIYRYKSGDVGTPVGALQMMIKW